MQTEQIEKKETVKNVLSTQEQNLITQLALKTFYPEALEGLGRAVTIANWVKQITIENEGSQPMSSVTKLDNKQLIEIANKASKALTILDDDFDGIMLNSSLKLYVKEFVSGLANYLTKEPNPVELTEYLIKQLNQFSSSVVYEYNQALLTK